MNVFHTTCVLKKKCKLCEHTARTSLWWHWLTSLVKSLELGDREGVQEILKPNLCCLTGQVL